MVDEKDCKNIIGYLGRGMKRLIILVIVFSIGCAAPSQVLRHPQTGQIAKCESFGWGWLGTPMALIMHQDCIDKMKESGYIPIGEKVVDDP